MPVMLRKLPQNLTIQVDKYFYIVTMVLQTKKYGLNEKNKKILFLQYNLALFRDFQ